MRLGALVVVTLLAACASKQGDASLTAVDSSGRTSCPMDAEGRANPLIVDLQPEQRSDIETAARRNLVVVRYDCKTLEVLPRCEASGGYRYAGGAPKEQMIRMTDSHEIEATLPLAGAGIAATLDGELASGKSLDLALVMVGKLTAARTVYSTDELRGDCAGATHVIHSLTLGAFALSTGTRSEARTVAGVFGAGVTAASASSSSISTKDGSLESCAQATSQQSLAPEGCAAALRIELLPVKEPLPEMAIVGESTAGLFRGKICPVPADCSARCDSGDGQACREWGLLLIIGDRVPRDLGKSTTAFQRACELDDMLACTLIGLALITRGPRADATRGHALLDRACERGNAVACRGKGEAARNAADEEEALRYFRRACQLGDNAACEEARSP